MPNTFKNFANANVGTTTTTVYTCPAATQTTVIGMTVANTTTNNITASVQVNHAGTDVFLVKDAMVPAGGALVPVGGDQKLVLEAGDTIRVTSSIANSIDAIVSVLEIS